MEANSIPKRDTSDYQMAATEEGEIDTNWTNVTEVEVQQTSTNTSGSLKSNSYHLANLKEIDIEAGEPALCLRQLSNAKDTDSVGDLISSPKIQELVFHELCYSIDATNVAKPRGSLNPKNMWPFRSKSVARDQPSSKLKILNKVSGQAKASEMLALMGPSGSGKTSLLNVLAQRVPSKTVTGRVLVDGRPLVKAFKRQMGFVFQDDLLLWNLTVKETMLFAAKLRLPQSLPLSEKESRVDELLEKLGLSDVASSIIGKEGRRGVSGGERKRASIGVELITGPAVLFLDEPTSGLDSSTALSIVTLLRQLARGGMIVICSIHQPRANIFSQFDKVLLLAKGKTAYYGKQRDIVTYFKNFGLELPPYTNAADWILDLTAGSAAIRVPPNNLTLTDAYTQSLEGLGDEELRKLGIPTDRSINNAINTFQDTNIHQSWVTSFWYQLKVLLERQSKQSRGEFFTGINIFQIFSVAIIASAVWWKSTNIDDITGVFFFISIQQSFNALTGIMRVFPAERGLMMRERSTGSYRVGPYFLAKSFSDIYLYILFPALYATIVYFSVGLRPSASHFVIYLILFLSEIMAAQSMGMLISAAIKDFATAQSFSFVLVLVIMLFGGFYVNNDRIPAGIEWIKYLSFLYWGYGALLVNEFEGRYFPCTDDNIGRYGDTCPIPGVNVLKAFRFDEIEIWSAILILLAMFFAMRFATYCVLRVSTKLKG